MRLGIINGSMTPSRNGFAIADWLEAEVARQATQHDVEVALDRIDLVDLGLPFSTEPNLPRLGQYQFPHTKAWSARIAALDAYIFLSPEENQSFNAVIKNALDYLYAEWNDKPAGLVTYGLSVSAGLQGGAQLRTVLAALHILTLQEGVTIPFVGTLVHAGRFDPTPPIEQGAAIMIEALFSAERALTAYRSTRQQG
jgi:NAD(P)H-dependent FMN reductase